ncbi:MAG: crotonase/enoyl-CoA hydratase family protein [Pseudomonadales bacterium]
MLTYEKHTDVALLSIDDGKANAVGYEFMEAVNGGLDRALAEAKAVVIVGRPGVLSGGFDLQEIRKGLDAATALVDQGARLMLRLFSHPQPVVIGCSGHAVAAGAFLLLSSDTRVGVGGDFRIGLNETAIGMTLPIFGLTLARERLSKRHLSAAVIQAQMFDPHGARDAGFLDEVVSADDLRARALARASELAQLPGEAYASNKLGARQVAIDTIRASLD